MLTPGRMPIGLTSWRLGRAQLNRPIVWFSAAPKPSMGHEERFPPTRLSAGFGFRKETIAGMRRNRQDAPKADPSAAGESKGSSRPQEGVAG